MKYTLEQFEIDFENAPDSMKLNVLSNAIDELDLSDPEVRNRLQDYKQEVKDLKYQIAYENDIKCNSDIDNGVYKLYTCVKEVPRESFVVGDQYYALVEDIKEIYTKHIEKMCGGDFSKITPEITEYLSKLKSYASIITDDGIGTLKKSKSLPYSVIVDDEEIPLEFNDYFKE